jgi:hypothetical protein
MSSATMRNVIAASVLFLLLLCACGERPKRLGKEAASPGTSAASATAPAGAVRGQRTVRFGGTILLEGGLAAVQDGAIFVSARRKGQRLPTLSHKYELGDPSWKVQDGNKVLPFSLTDEDNMAGFGAPMGGEMEVEARYSPSGFIDPRPASDDESIVRSSVSAAPGDTKLAIRLQATSGK